jgi:two-component system, NtrC family, sensor histidine kinase HydH
LLLSSVLVLISGIVFGIIAISSGRASLTDAVGRQLAEEARNTADRVTALLDEKRAGLSTIARQDLMREVRIGDLDKRIANLLASAKKGDPACLELIVTDTDRKLVASSDPSTLERGRLPIALPIAEGLHGPVFSEQYRRQSLGIAVPIHNPDRPEELAGLLIGLFDWERETALLEQVQSNLRSVGLDVDVLLLDERGVIIGAATRAGSPRAFGVSLRADGWATASLEEAGFHQESAARALVGHAPLARPPWSILVTEPIREALQPVRQMTLQLGVALGVVIVTAAGIAGILAGRVTRPLRELTRATRELPHAKQEMPLVRTRLRDEVGELAEAFNQMTIDLRRTEAQLLEAEKFAFVGEVAAGIAHEVRTTLGILRSSAQLLQPTLEAEGGEAAELVHIMLEEVQRLDSVVADLLTLGRPRELALELRRLSEPVFRAVDVAAPQARGKGVGIKKIAPEREPLTLCDEEQMYQVALNLLVNAIEVLPAGGTVTVAIDGEADGFTGFEVRDDGPGISEENRERIFQPFFTQREGGTGLGLTFVQRVVHEHNGRVSVDSDVGRGSVFRVLLPVASESPA